MNSKIVAGASILAIVAVLASAQPASARNWACGGGCYPGYAFAPGYGYYGAYDSIPWNYRGGPHPR